MRIQVTLLPVRSETLPPDRVLGLYQPLASMTALRGRPAVGMKLLNFDDLSGEPALPRIRLAALDGRRIA